MPFVAWYPPLRLLLTVDHWFTQPRAKSALHVGTVHLSARHRMSQPSSPRNIRQNLAAERRRRLRPIRGRRRRHLTRRGDRGRRSRPQDAQRRPHQNALLALPAEGQPGRVPVRRMLGSGVLQPRLLCRGDQRISHVRFHSSLQSLRPWLREFTPPLGDDHATWQELICRAI